MVRVEKIQEKNNKQSSTRIFDNYEEAEDFCKKKNKRLKNSKYIITQIGNLY